MRWSSRLLATSELVCRRTSAANSDVGFVLQGGQATASSRGALVTQQDRASFSEGDFDDSSALLVNYDADRKTRRRSKSKCARPYICRFIVFSRLMCPSTGPLLHGYFKAALTAASSDFRLFAKTTDLRRLTGRSGNSVEWMNRRTVLRSGLTRVAIARCERPCR